ncbi:MAG: hypothetical protein ACOCZH_03365, partial [Phototrophicaceae bacterium]
MSAVQDFPGAAGASPGVEAAPSARPRALTVLTGVTVIAVLAGLFLALSYAGTDVIQGEVQRIFYIHMPSFFGAFLAFG